MRAGDEAVLNRATTMPGSAFLQNSGITGGRLLRARIYRRGVEFKSGSYQDQDQGVIKLALDRNASFRFLNGAGWFRSAFFEIALLIHTCYVLASPTVNLCLTTILLLLFACLTGQPARIVCEVLDFFDLPSHARRLMRAGQRRVLRTDSGVDIELLSIGTKMLDQCSSGFLLRPAATDHTRMPARNSFAG